MNPVLARWNSIDPTLAAEEILPCCGSRAWAAELAARRPIADEDHLLISSDAVWVGLPEAAWQEAFDSHPRIGQQKAKAATETSLGWSASEQSAAMSADDAAKLALAEGNRLYEEKFGRIFIVCASGRSATEILAILEARMKNDAVAELHEAAEQQRQITQLRLQRWLEEK
jgi:2-oxo-4-hydroxy-4-carboxy-5-ureidoimidazoline decarboxylase